MNLMHAPAEADAEDTLHLENGNLSMETEGNEYQLNDNVLGVIRNRLNGSVTAEAWVYAAAPEKLVEFKCDSNGLRTQKKVTDHGQVVVTDYIYHGEKLVGLNCGNDTLHFFYDAWGKPLGITGALPATLGQKTFRYRRYIYDQEADIYYLRSRYHNMIRKIPVLKDQNIPRQSDTDLIQEKKPMSERNEQEMGESLFYITRMVHHIIIPMCPLAIYIFLISLPCMIIIISL